MIPFDVVVLVRGREFHVVGDIAPEEPSHWSEWDGGYPGCPASIEDAKICLLSGKREREIQEPANPTKAQEKAWSNFFYAIECSVFEVLED